MNSIDPWRSGQALWRNRKDLWRSQVRHALDRLRDTAARLQRPADALQWLHAQALGKHNHLGETALRAHLARAAGVHAVSLACVDKGLLIDAEGKNGETLSCLLVPGECRFAPRGAKELVFLTQPPQAATHPLLRPLIASLAQAIALRLWLAPALTPAEDEPASGIVETDGFGKLRIDLRSLRQVRLLTQRPGWSWLLDSLELASLRASRSGLQLQVRLTGQRR